MMAIFDAAAISPMMSVLRCTGVADGHFVTLGYVARNGSCRLLPIDVRPHFARTIGAAVRIPDSPWRRFYATC